MTILPRAYSTTLAPSVQVQVCCIITYNQTHPYKQSHRRHSSVQQTQQSPLSSQQQQGLVSQQPQQPTQPQLHTPPPQLFKTITLTTSSTRFSCSRTQHRLRRFLRPAAHLFIRKLTTLPALRHPAQHQDCSRPLQRQLTMVLRQRQPLISLPQPQPKTSSTRCRQVWKFHRRCVTPLFTTVQRARVAALASDHYSPVHRTSRLQNSSITTTCKFPYPPQLLATLAALAMSQESDPLQVYPPAFTPASVEDQLPHTSQQPALMWELEACHPLAMLGSKIPFSAASSASRATIDLPSPALSLCQSNPPWVGLATCMTQSRKNFC